MTLRLSEPLPNLSFDSVATNGRRYIFLADNHAQAMKAPIVLFGQKQKFSSRDFYILLVKNSIEFPTVVESATERKMPGSHQNLSASATLKILTQKAARQRVSCDPWHVAFSEQGDLPWWTSWREIHALFFV